MANRSRLFGSRKVRTVFAALVLMALVFGIFEARQTINAHRKSDSFGVCGGYSLKLLDQIPVGVIRAVYKYLAAYKPVEILGNISEVDPQLESSTPHRCPEMLDSWNIPPVQERIHLSKIGSVVLYSGDIPPGATKAFMVGVTHAVKIATYTGNDPTIAAGVKANPYTTSNVIVAFYPDKGWVGVYDDPGSYGGFHH